MKKHVFLVMLVFISLMLISASADVVIDKNAFPDPNFMKYVRVFDLDKDGTLNDDEIYDAQLISCSGLSIKSLKGIEYFTNAKQIWCSRNSLTSLDVSNNLCLDELCCTENKKTLTSIKLNDYVSSLDFSETPISSLDLSDCPNLFELWIEKSKLKKLDVSHNPKLKILQCSNSSFQEIILNNPCLIEMDCSYTKIKSLDLSGAPALKIFHCRHCPIEKLNLSKNRSLTELNCSHCKLKQLNIKKNTKLKILDCVGNPLNKLDLSNNTELEELYCIETSIFSLDLRNCHIIANYIMTHKKQKSAWGEIIYGTSSKIYLQASHGTTLRLWDTAKGLRFQLNHKDGTAVFLAPDNSNTTTLVIPSTVTIEGKTYKVTEIRAGACKNLSKLTKLTIGNNVIKIGKDAFNGCKHLGNIVIRSSKLTDKAIGSNAFKTSCKKTTVKCPKKVLKDYKTILLKKGLKKKGTKFAK